MVIQFHQQAADHLAAALPGLPPGKTPGHPPQQVRQQRGPGIIRYRGSSDCRILVVSHEPIMIAAAAPLRGQPS
jgi:broad specificity phosphatase PhoE